MYCFIESQIRVTVGRTSATICPKLLYSSNLYTPLSLFNELIPISV